MAAIHMADIKGGKYYSRECRDKADSKFFIWKNHPKFKRRFPVTCQTCKKTFYLKQDLLLV
jgi:hypothetical protein